MDQAFNEGMRVQSGTGREFRWFAAERTIPAQPMPGPAGPGGGLGDGIDGAEEIGGASGWCAHGPKAKPEHPRTPVLTMNSSGTHTRWPMKGLGPTGCGE